ncbi:ABC-2 type transporter family protein [Clostridium sporogenes]|uniref:ABC-2 type transporter family protein n=1 Tax=Clostridium sporogenes TaxID=1509 RepID=A0A1L3NHI8_CLOSG|nr:ABC transporter permease [Clostridium sporogenes]APH15576.1 ABC-2 type transporter family protein [Clostridium sporogenes]
MKQVFLLTKSILKRTFRKKSNIITFILLPLLAVFIALFLNASGTSYSKIGVVDLNESYLSKDMIKSIDSKKNFVVVKVSKNNMNKQLLDKKVDCVVVIPKDFHKEIMEGNFKKLDIISVRGEDITSWIKNCLNYYIDNLTNISLVSNKDEKTFKDMYDGFKKQDLKLNYKTIGDKTKSKSVTKQSIGLLLVFMLIASSTASSFILKDKANKTYYRIFCSNISKSKYIIANVIANFIIFLIQIFVILFMSLYVLKLNFYIDTKIMFIILCSFGFVSIGFGIIIAAFSKSLNQSSYLSNILITPTCMLSGCFWPLDMMPNFMQKLANIFPQTWILKAIDSLQQGKSFNEAILYIGIVILFAVSFFIIGILKLTKDENLKSIF